MSISSRSGVSSTRRRSWAFEIAYERRSSEVKVVALDGHRSVGYAETRERHSTRHETRESSCVGQASSFLIQPGTQCLGHLVDYFVWYRLMRIVEGVEVQNREGSKEATCR
jgi:hypothetical protein